MECNRDEALRAKEIAEMKFSAKDMKGAKKFALKAQNLYPELEGISQMMMTLEVYISAEEEKMHAESNWYGVLGVTPLADDETIRKQYRKLALLLHPDKNRSIGAEGAFQLISQAWSVLSDKSKRIAYDQRYGKTGQQRNMSKNEGSSPPPTQNGFYNFANTAASQTRVQKGNSSKRNHSSSPHASRKKERRTFWTVCHRCKMQYEYLRMYLNHNLLCPNCHEAYFAVEIDPPSNKGSKIPQTSDSQPRKNTSNSGNHNNFQWVPFSESTGAQSAVQAANMVQQAYQKVKRERQKAQAAARKEEALRRKSLASKRTMGGEPSVYSDATKRRKGVEDCGINKEKTEQVNSKNGTLHQGKCAIKHEGVGIKDLLVEKVRSEVHKKLNECLSAAMVRNEAGEEVLRNMKEKEMPTTINDGIATDGFMCSQNKLCESLKSESQLPLNKLNPYLDSKLVEQMSVTVLDSDFHDFDKNRMEKCFGENQIWAVYDDDDGMPRHYAMIQSVISLNPFKVRLSWLSSATHCRIGELSWFLSGFLKTWGEFGERKHEICSSIDCFSHKVRWSKGTSKTFLIFPRKGDVWALYRNWSPEWNELTEEEVIHKYDMVEVLEDYDEELGVIVIPLVKVTGFKTVFHQHFNAWEIRRIPKEEMSRFSHQVPSYLLTGREGMKSPKGCLELDPAAVPSQFLQVMSNIEAIEFMETNEDIEFVKAANFDSNTSTCMIEGIS
ncbi:hypothetical protein ACS0TY_010930 [Phlomoides rotata]